MVKEAPVKPPSITRPPEDSVINGQYLLFTHTATALQYTGPNAAHARNPGPPDPCQRHSMRPDGRSSSGTLCMLTGILSMEQIVIKSAPIWP